MQKVLILVLALLSVSLATNNLGRNPNFRQFISWMKTTGARYTEDELVGRYNNWLSARTRIAQLNAVDPSIDYAINQFSAMTAEEFQSYPCGVSVVSALDTPVSDVSVSYAKALPTSFDWTTEGVAAQVKDQSLSGACGVYSATATIEGVYAVAKGTNVDLSEQQLIDCVESTLPSSIMAAAVDTGVTDAKVYQPNTRIFSRSSCRYDAETAVITPKKVDVMCNGNGYCSEFDMANVLYANGPLSICFNATLLQDYSAGILNPTKSQCGSKANHCATIVGFGEEKGQKFWKVKNSWGQKWGEQGFFRIARGTGACGINSIVSTVRV